MSGAARRSPGPTAMKTTIDHESLQPVLERIVSACHTRMGRPLSAEDLEDVVQSVRVVMLSAGDRFEGRSSLETWLYGVARIEILARRRERWTRYTEPLETEPPANTSGTGHRMGSGTRLQVSTRLKELGTTVHEIVLSRHGHGESFRSIAARLGMSLSRIRSSYYRSLPIARERLRPLWEKLGG